VLGYHHRNPMEVEIFYAKMPPFAAMLFDIFGQN
jgi:hypothetical protein